MTENRTEVTLSSTSESENQITDAVWIPRGSMFSGEITEEDLLLEMSRGQGQKAYLAIVATGDPDVEINGSPYFLYEVEVESIDTSIVMDGLPYPTFLEEVLFEPDSGLVITEAELLGQPAEDEYDLISREEVVEYLKTNGGSGDQAKVRRVDPLNVHLIPE